MDFHVAAIGDRHSARHGVRQLPKHIRHFLGRLEIKLVRGELHALAVAHRLAGLDAHQHFLRMSVGAGQIVAIVRSDKRNAGFARELHEIAIDARLDLHSLVLHLEEEIPLAKNVAQAIRVGFRLVVFLRDERVSHFAAQAGRERNQSFAVLLKKIVIDARFVIEAIEKPGGNQLNQIAIAFFILCEQDEMVRPLRIAAAILVIIGRDIYFAADDGFYPVSASLMKEIRGGKKISVVGNRNRRHASARRFGRQFADFASAVQERVVRVQM